MPKPQVIHVSRKTNAENVSTIMDTMVSVLSIYVSRAIALTTQKDFAYEPYADCVMVSLHLSKWQANQPTSIRYGFEIVEGEKLHFENQAAMVLFLRHRRENLQTIPMLTPRQEEELARCLESCKTIFLPRAFEVFAGCKRATDPMIELILEFKRGMHIRHTTRETFINPGWSSNK